ncbi:Cytochrome P450 4d8 [Trichinella pseudospiralis]
MSLLPPLFQASDDELKGSFAQDIDMVSEHQPNVSRWQVSQMNPISSSPIFQVRLSRQWIYTATASISAEHILFCRKQRVICIVNSVL